MPTHCNQAQAVFNLIIVEIFRSIATVDDTYCNGHNGILQCTLNLIPRKLKARDYREVLVEDLFQQLECIVSQSNIAKKIVVLDFPLGIPHECVHRISNLILNTDKSGNINHHGAMGFLMTAQITHCIRNKE